MVSHGDLDHKNVLWSETGEPLVIDWESARRLNPTYGNLAGGARLGASPPFDTRPFTTILRAYVDAGGLICPGYDTRGG